MTEMEKKLRFKSCYVVCIYPPDLVCLFTEKEAQYLKGEVYAACVPFLKAGRYSAAEIALKLKKRISMAETFFMLDRMESEGFVEEVLAKGDRNEEAFCALAKLPYHESIARLKKVRVFVAGFGKVSTASLASVLRANGIHLARSLKKADLCVVLTDDYLDEAIALFQKKLPRKMSQLFVKPVGTELWLGPLLKEGKSPCFHCLSQNMKRHRIEELAVKEKQKLSARSVASLPSTLELAYHLAATEIYKWIISDEASVLNGQLLTFDLLTLKNSEHQLIVSPKCSVCSKKKAQEPKPPVLAQEGRSISNDGGWRVANDQETWERLHHRISSILGVVPNVRKRGEAGKEIHVFNCGKNYTHIPLPGLQELARDFVCTGGSGKGKTALQSKLSAIGEYIELYSATHQGNEPAIRGTYRELKSEAIHPHDLLLFSNKQYEEREKRNENAAHPSAQIPFPFDEKRTVEWSPVWSLTEKRRKYVPTNCCYLGYHAKIVEPFCYDSPNGYAAGTTIEEALLHALFEMIERDAIGIWWYNALPKQGVDLNSFNDPFIDQLLKSYEKIGKKVWVLDLTHDLGIPIFAALTSSLAHKDEFPSVRFGAHLDPRIALARALTELNQCPFAFQTVHHPLTLRDRERAFLTPVSGLQKKAVDYSPPEVRDLFRAIRICQERLEKLGLEVLILDVSRPETDLKVVKVMIPGLRHFLPRHAPGRLYDVPVKLGWLTKPREEKALNPLDICTPLAAAK